MTARSLFTVLLLPTLLYVARADDTAPSPSAHQLLKQRLAEEAAQPTPATTGAPVTPTATAAVAAATPTPTTSATADKNPIVAVAPPTTTTDSSTTKKPDNAHAQPATVLPKVEVRKGRITKLDQDLAKEDQEIAREKQNTKPTDLDKALNNSAITKPLAMFGGESADYRKQISSERVSLMEDEKDLIEAIAHAKTKEEKAQLQKQLDALREERRLLEQMQR
jgi:hypothetical protein